MSQLIRRITSQLSIKNIRTYNESKQYEPFEKKPILLRRYGYKKKYHDQGLLPRLKDQKNAVKSAYNFKKKPDEWHIKKALFGQNDYIDILGNGNIKPHELLREMPWWLRGFKEGNELHMLQRMQAVKGDQLKLNRPKKWKEIEARIDFLYKYMNFRHKPPKASNY